MKLSFFCERGKMPEIGTGHYYRSIWAIDYLYERGHQAGILMPGEDLSDGIDVLVIDDLRSQRPLMDKARKKGIKVVLIDGVPDDVPYADLSISSCFNPKAEYRGVKYMAFLNRGSRSYNYSESIKDTVFVSMGGFDANNIAPMVLGVLREFGLKAVVTKSINHSDFSKVFTDISVYEGDDYYHPMSKCEIGVVNGGLTMFQALHFGIPSLTIPQYDHQRNNIKMVESGCILSEPKKKDIRICLNILLKDENYRRYLSKEAQNLVDGDSIKRTCDLIEEIG